MFLSQEQRDFKVVGMRKHGIIYLSGLFQDPITNSFVAVLYVFGLSACEHMVAPQMAG